MILSSGHKSNDMTLFAHECKMQVLYAAPFSFLSHSYEL